MAILIISAQIKPAAIHKGEISASKEVRKHFKFSAGCSAIEFEAFDELGDKYTLKAKRRMRGKYPKGNIVGLKSYIRRKGLVEGDRITIFRVRNEVKIFGVVLRHPVYSIHHEKSAQGGGNFTGAEAGEN